MNKMRFLGLLFSAAATIAFGTTPFRRENNSLRYSSWTPCFAAFDDASTEGSLKLADAVHSPALEHALVKIFGFHLKTDPQDHPDAQRLVCDILAALPKRAPEYANRFRQEVTNFGAVPQVYYTDLAWFQKEADRYLTLWPTDTDALYRETVKGQVEKVIDFVSKSPFFNGCEMWDIGKGLRMQWGKLSEHMGWAFVDYLSEFVDTFGVAGKPAVNVTATSQTESGALPFHITHENGFDKEGPARFRRVRPDYTNVDAELLRILYLDEQNRDAADGNLILLMHEMGHWVSDKKNARAKEDRHNLKTFESVHTNYEELHNIGPVLVAESALLNSSPASNIARDHVERLLENFDEALGDDTDSPPPACRHVGNCKTGQLLRPVVVVPADFCESQAIISKCTPSGISQAISGSCTCYSGVPNYMQGHEYELSENSLRREMGWPQRYGHSIQIDREAQESDLLLNLEDMRTQLKQRVKKAGDAIQASTACFNKKIKALSKNPGSPELKCTGQSPRSCKSPEFLQKLIDDTKAIRGRVLKRESRLRRARKGESSDDKTLQPRENAFLPPLVKHFLENRAGAASQSDTGDNEVAGDAVVTDHELEELEEQLLHHNATFVAYVAAFVADLQNSQHAPISTPESQAVIAEKVEQLGRYKKSIEAIAQNGHLQGGAFGQEVQAHAEKVKKAIDNFETSGATPTVVTMMPPVVQPVLTPTVVQEPVATIPATPTIDDPMEVDDPMDVDLEGQNPTERKRKIDAIRDGSDNSAMEPPAKRARRGFFMAH